MKPEPQKSKQVLFYAAVAGFLVFAPLIMPDNYWLRIYTMAGLYVMLALGLNVVAGFAGLLDLAYVAFYGIGGYVFALLSSGQFNIHWPFWLVWPLAALTAMLCGFALGATSMRLKGDYLAIVTLAFAQIFKLLLLNLDRPVNITGGVNGIYNFDPILILGFKIASPVAFAYLIWAAALLVALGCSRLKNSRYGRGWQAIREDELSAEASGVNTGWMKLTAFAGGALIAGGAGVLSAAFQDSVFPNNFDFQQLVIIYCMVILGGLGNIPGVILGAMILAVLPEFLREYGAYRMMAFGLILVVLMALRPQGIMGSIAIFKKKEKRPDKDESGRLKASTDLYYQKEPMPEGIGEEPMPNGVGKKTYSRGERVMLELQHISRHFGGLNAVDDLSLNLHEHEILSIIGPNGAGKTTLFNLISGIYAPDAGAVFFQGRDVTGWKPHQIVKAGLARTFQNIRLFNNLTVQDNALVGQFCRTQAGPLSVLLHLPRFKREEHAAGKRVQEVLALFGTRLSGYRLEQQAQYLSYANRRRLEITRALATQAEVLLLDEPSAGMNPQETLEIADFIKTLRDRHGYTIILIEHKLGLVQSISDRVIVLDYGKKIAEGCYSEVACNRQVIEAYLGRKKG